ncbi:SDR family NAD(P)-dependent oxidoreductase [Metabacillus herbersteinensis]|uniref:SDR family NAD(P)-dependent oxidoreductase n=1 Tax=Metabacillus herbersteinensis TaxID=283816 RepID=A0ABV6GHT4_9BACI
MTNQMKRFENKVALVTGGRSGIGRAIARRLRDEGATVITAQRGEDEDFESIAADFSNPYTPEQIVKEVIVRHGQLDVLVNNAGMMQEARIEEMTLEDWQRNLNVNLTGPFLMIRAALPYLRKTRGSIVNTGPIEGLAANPGHAAYCATKAGLHGL